MLLAQGGGFKQDLAEKMLGTGQSCSYESKVFITRGSIVYDYQGYITVC